MGTDTKPHLGHKWTILSTYEVRIIIRYEEFVLEREISFHNILTWGKKKKIQTSPRSVANSRIRDDEHGNDGIIFPLLDACALLVGVLNGGEAQFEGVRVRSSWKNRTTINGMKTICHQPAGSQPVSLTPTCVFHLVVVHHGQSLHGIIDGLPLQQPWCTTVTGSCCTT